MDRLMAYHRCQVWVISAGVDPSGSAATARSQRVSPGTTSCSWVGVEPELVRLGELAGEGGGTGGIEVTGVWVNG